MSNLFEWSDTSPPATSPDETVVDYGTRVVVTARRLDNLNVYLDGATNGASVAFELYREDDVLFTVTFVNGEVAGAYDSVGDPVFLSVGDVIGLRATVSGGTLSTGGHSFEATVTGGFLGSAIWHEVDPLDPGAGLVTRYEVEPSNWSWGTARWWYGWVILDMSDRWVLDRWGDTGDWGDGGVWGSNAEPGECVSLNAVIAKWKPQNVPARMVFTFDPDFYKVENAAPPNPTNGRDFAWQAQQEANFFAVQL